MKSTGGKLLVFLSGKLISPVISIEGYLHYASLSYYECLYWTPLCLSLWDAFSLINNDTKAKIFASVWAELKKFYLIWALLIQIKNMVKLENVRWDFEKLILLFLVGHLQDLRPGIEFLEVDFRINDWLPVDGLFKCNHQELRRWKAFWGSVWGRYDCSISMEHLENVVKWL